MVGQQISLADQKVQVRHRQDSVLVYVGLSKRRPDRILIPDGVKLEVVDGGRKAENHGPGAIDTGGASANEVGRRALVLWLRGHQHLFPVCRRESYILCRILVCDNST